MPVSLPSWSRFRRGIASLVRTSCERLSPGIPFPDRMPTVVHREVVEVPEDSEDAKKWPLWPGSGVPNQNTADIVNLASSSSAALVNSSTENSKSRARGPRKPKIVLPPLPASSQHKTKKLTTLDKSSMDWKAHLNSDGATTKDELEANRRSEGYLGKIGFLQRVSERKDSILEENQAKKRRR